MAKRSWRLHSLHILSVGVHYLVRVSCLSITHLCRLVPALTNELSSVISRLLCDLFSADIGLR